MGLIPWIDCLGAVEKLVDVALSKLKACPFCGDETQSIENTHTASFWVECQCGAEMHGAPLDGRGIDEDYDLDAYAKAIDSAVQLWNSRV